MGMACVRAVEPGYDQLPARLKHRSPPVKLHDVDGSAELPVGHMLSNGHEQSKLEANLEAWVLRQSSSLGEVLAHKPWPLEGCSSIVCNEANPQRCAGAAVAACSQVHQSSPRTLEEQMILCHHRDDGVHGDGTAQELAGLPVAVEQQQAELSRPALATPIIVPATISMMPANAPPQPSLGIEPFLVAGAAAQVPFTAAGGADDSPTRNDFKTRLCDAFCCRQEVTVGQEKVVILDQQHFGSQT